MRKPRFTIRHLMVAVAVVAVLIYGAQLWRLRMGYLAKAQMYSALTKENEQSVSFLRGMADLIERGSGEVRYQANPVQLRKDAARVGQLAANHERLWKKYERLARNPWLSNGPDPLP